MSQGEELLTVTELSGHLKVSKDAIQEWARTGRIPEVKLTSHVRRFRLSEVLEALQRACAEAPKRKAKK